MNKPTPSQPSQPYQTFAQSLPDDAARLTAIKLMLTHHLQQPANPLLALVPQSQEKSKW